MQRVCFVLQVKPERLEEYKERHRAVWLMSKRGKMSAGSGKWRFFDHVSPAPDRVMETLEEVFHL